MAAVMDYTIIMITLLNSNNEFISLIPVWAGAVQNNLLLLFTDAKTLAQN